MKPHLHHKTISLSVSFSVNTSASRDLLRKAGWWQHQVPCVPGCHHFSLGWPFPADTDKCPIPSCLQTAHRARLGFFWILSLKGYLMIRNHLCENQEVTCVCLNVCLPKFPRLFQHSAVSGNAELQLIMAQSTLFPQEPFSLQFYFCGIKTTLSFPVWRLFSTKEKKEIK